MTIIIIVISTSAASCALLAPVLVPTPSMAVPLCAMISRISAKSTLTNPGVVIISEIPYTPCLSTSSAKLKASVRGTCLCATSNNRSFGTKIRVSTCSRNFEIPSTACKPFATIFFFTLIISLTK